MTADDERLALIECRLDWLVEQFCKLRLARRQVLLQELGLHEEALNIVPRTAELRRHAKRLGLRQESPAAPKVEEAEQEAQGQTKDGAGIKEAE